MRHYILLRYPEIVETEISSGMLRLELLPNAGFPLNFSNENCLLDWERITHDKPIPYEHSDSEAAVQIALSSLVESHDFFYVELQSDMPIVQVPAQTFFKNWHDFVDVSAGLGCIVTSPEFTRVVEFSTDQDNLMYLSCPVS